MNEDDLNGAIDTLASLWRQETETTVMKLVKGMEFAICGKNLKAWLDKSQEEVTPLIAWFLHENFDLEETVFNDDFLIAAMNKMRSSFQDGHYGTIASWTGNVGKDGAPILNEEQFFWEVS